MAIGRVEALAYVEKGQQEKKPVLVHGTSVESAIELIRGGRMVAPSLKRGGDSVCPENRGYLFFVPRKQAFVRHPLYNEIVIDKEAGLLEEEVKVYAKIHQQIRFLGETLGFWPWELDPIYFISGEVGLRELGEMGVDVDKIRKYGIRKLADDTDKRAGVVLGINDRIFDQRIELAPYETDRGKEVMIHLPDGLDRKYLDYVYPFGNLEREALDGFVGSLS